MKLSVRDLSEDQRTVIDVLLMSLLRKMRSLDDVGDADLIDAGLSLIEAGYICIVQKGDMFSLEPTDKGIRELGMA